MLLLTRKASRDLAKACVTSRVTAVTQRALHHEEIRGCHDGCHTACHTAEPSYFFAWILVIIFCPGLPVKRREEDRG